MKCPACDTDIPQSVIDELESLEIFDCAECGTELLLASDKQSVSEVEDEDFEDEDYYEDEDEDEE